MAPIAEAIFLYSLSIWECRLRFSLIIIINNNNNNNNNNNIIIIYGIYIALYPDAQSALQHSPAYLGAHCRTLPPRSS